MGKKLIIDLARCQPQAVSGVRCSYAHHPHNQGIDALLEMIRFALICRRCEAAPCVQACPHEALEKQPADKTEDRDLFVGPQPKGLLQRRLVLRLP